MGLTRKRDLRSGNPVWTAYRQAAIPTRRLNSNREEDVVVIGAGISGALISQALAEMGRPPLILDRRNDARLGSTAASTALLQFELDTPLIKFSESVGRRSANDIWICSRDAVRELRTRAHRLGIDARIRSRPSLYLAGNILDTRGLRRETEARRRLGLASELLERKALKHHFSIDRPAAILSHGNLEADPVALTAEFLIQAIHHGARVCAPHEVVDLERGKQWTILTTNDGFEIRARHVVLCTGYEFPKIVPMGKNRIISTWPIATRPQPTRLWPQRALIWEASEPYLYLRSTLDGRLSAAAKMKIMRRHDDATGRLT